MIWYKDKILNNDEWTLDQKVRAVVYDDRELKTSFYISTDDVCTMLIIFESKRIGCQRQMNTHPKGPKYAKYVAEIWQRLIDMLVEYRVEHGPDEILIDA